MVDRNAGVTYRSEYAPGLNETGSAPRRFGRGICAVGGLLACSVMAVLLVKVVSFPPTPPTSPAAKPLTPGGEETFAPPSPAKVEAPPVEEGWAARVEKEVPLEAEPAKAVATAPPRPAQTPRPAAAASLPVAGAGPVAPEPKPEGAPSPWRSSFTDAELAEMLQKVPTVSLLEAAPVQKAGKSQVDPRRQALQDLENAARKHRERFVDHLLAKRPDLAGLPFQKGKDCQLDEKAAKELGESSREVRQLLANTFCETGRSRTEAPKLPDTAVSLICYQLAKSPRLMGPQGLGALDQILTGEPAPLRLALVRHLISPPDSPVAATVLTRRALFDISAEVRQGAIAGLSFLAPGQYVPLLLKGLHYPWPPANLHAADALVALRAETAVPELVKLLDAPDPCAPFELDEGGQKGLAVRELVRLNHHANCLLCHAPAQTRGEPVLGPVPDPSRPLPPRFSSAYEGRRSSGSGLFVRADITYLRQDFSEVQPVEKPGQWPGKQRFDFLVRVRRLAEDEALAWRLQERLPGPPALPASRKAALFALQELTGLDGGFTAASWKRALATRPRTAGSK